MRIIGCDLHARQQARILEWGPSALATEVFLGDAGRFDDGKALASYVGIIPREYSSGGQQRLGGAG